MIFTGEMFLALKTPNERKDFIREFCKLSGVSPMEYMCYINLPDDKMMKLEVRELTHRIYANREIDRIINGFDIDTVRKEPILVKTHRYLWHKDLQHFGPNDFVKLFSLGDMPSIEVNRCVTDNQYHLFGKFHRIGGLARNVGETKGYYLHGVWMKEEEYWLKVKLQRVKEL